MGVADLYEVYYTVVGAMDQMFEFWLAASFAVILACYFAAEILTRWFYLAISFAYIVFSILTGARFYSASIKLTEFRARLEAAGEVFDTGVFFAVGVLHMMLYVLGSIATLAYLYRSATSARDS